MSKGSKGVEQKIWTFDECMAKGASQNGQATFGFLFHAFGRFHRVYSMALLNAAYKKLLSETDLS